VASCLEKDILQTNTNICSVITFIVLRKFTKIGYQEKKSHNSETIVSAEQDSKTGNTKLTGKQMPSDAKSSLEPLAPAR
jgi:hypothetical protein